MNKALVEKSENECMYGTIYLGDCEFAIAADCIVEVVNLPTQMVKMPLTPRFVRGTFDLRGTTITVIDLMVLFENSETHSTHDKIAVLEFDGQYIGVLFDRIGRVFPGSRENFSEFDDRSSNPFVAGIFHGSADGQLVQVIDVEGLFKQSGVPKESSSKQNQREKSRRRDRGEKVHYLMFSLGDNKCAIPLTEIQEVFQLDRLIPSPMTGGLSCLGTTNLRDGNLPIFDLEALLGDKMLRFESDLSEGKDVVVMQIDSVALGLLVDSIDDIFFAYPDEIVDYPPTDLIQQDIFVGSIVKDPSIQVLVFDHAALLANQEVSDTTKVHGKLSSEPLRNRSIHKERQAEVNQTFLTFYGDARYAVRLHEVQEIIDLPEHLLRPPGLNNGILGVYNLRNQVSVAIADLTRSNAYGAENDTEQDRKVLIFDAKGGKSGLVIKALDSIVSVKEDSIFETEDLLASSAIQSTQMVRFEDQSHRIASVPIVDLPTVFEYARNS